MPQNWTWDADKNAELKTVYTDFHVGTKEIWFYGQQEYKSSMNKNLRSVPKMMFKINLTEANRINTSALKKVYEKACKTPDDF
jgi:hypothetical protein